jgi:murein DD-endopeptidase MepM/ murein hydrolase activator NlpD
MALFANPFKGINPEIVSGWGDDRSYRGAGKLHEGLDFAVPTGTPVHTVGEGVVSYSGFIEGPTGEIVTVDHPNGFRSYYMHLSERLVKKGDKVMLGQLVAKSGRTGVVNSGAHLHFAIRANNDALNLFRSRFGMPSTGFGPTKSGVTPVPSEPLVPGNYSKKVKMRAAAQGIPFAEIGFSLGTALLLAGGAFAVYRYWR